MAKRIILNEVTGEKITISSAARMVGVANSTIRTWADKEGITTLKGLETRDIKRRASMSEEHKIAIRRAKSVYFIEHKGVELSVSDIAKIVGLTVGTVRDYIKRIGLTTIKQVEERRDSMLKTGSKVNSFHKTPKGTLSVSEIYEIHPHRKTITKALISGRICRRGGMCPSLWWEKLNQFQFKERLIKEGLEVRAPKNLPEIVSEYIAPFEFPRRDIFCFKDHESCEWYKYCCDFRENKRQHSEKYIKDGSCFTKKTSYGVHTNSNHGSYVANSPTRRSGIFVS